MSKISEKELDSVALKRQLQDRLRSKFSGLTDEEERKKISEELANSDDIVARKWRRICNQQMEKP